ncbi:MAG TPA: YfiR family protein [Myxococcaceae bacterium]|nr:YfiR family protein [Myxococcaceae bacterium]
MRARALAALALLAAPAALADAEVPMAQQAVLILKILKFDRSLQARAGDIATIAILYADNDPESEAVRVELQGALEAAAHTVTFPLPIKVVHLPYSASKIDAELADAKPTAAYVAPGLASQVATLIKATRKSTTLTFTGDEALVRAGLAVGLVARGDRPTLLVNLPAAKAEGADLSSDLLRLSQVIR